MDAICCAICWQPMCRWPPWCVRARALPRWQGILGHWEEQAGRALPRPVVIEGDLCLDEVVPDDAQRRWLAVHCDRILSCAASMTFREDKRGEPFRTNVEGTRHLLELCRTAGIRHFHQVSTAYICGLRQGQILESDIDVGQTLGNVYEQSKLKAEKMIRAADFLDQRTFYRPASVVGDSKSGYVTSFHGFYLPLQLAHAMAGRVPVREMNERFFAKLGLKGHEGKNLVPVDWLSAAIVYLVTHPEHHGRTYHLASPDPVPVVEIQKVIRDAIEQYYPKPLATSISEQELQSLEGLFYEYMSIYQSHWRDDPKFDLDEYPQCAAASALPGDDVRRADAGFAVPGRAELYSAAARAAGGCVDVAEHLSPLVGTPRTGGRRMRRPASHRTRRRRLAIAVVRGARRGCRVGAAR